MHAMVHAALYPSNKPGQRIDVAWVAAAAGRMLAAMEEHRSIWRVWHVRAEARCDASGRSLICLHRRRRGPVQLRPNRRRGATSHRHRRPHGWAHGRRGRGRPCAAGVRGERGSPGRRAGRSRHLFRTTGMRPTPERRKTRGVDSCRTLESTAAASRSGDCRSPARRSEHLPTRNPIGARRATSSRLRAQRMLLCESLGRRHKGAARDTGREVMSRRLRPATESPPLGEGKAFMVRDGRVNDAATVATRRAAYRDPKRISSAALPEGRRG